MIDSMVKELESFRNRVDKTFFRTDMKELEKYRKDKLMEYQEKLKSFLVLEEKRTFEESLKEFEKDSKDILKNRMSHVFEPAKWFEIETGKGPKVLAMSVDEGVVISVEGQIVYVSCGKIYKVKDKYYLRSDGRYW
jgi:hypothetical protein